MIGTETLDGVDAYVVEWSYDSSCDFEDALTLEKATSSYAETNTPIDENTYTIIDRTWIDSESFLILKTESYINSADQANLIGTRVDRTITKTQPLLKYRTNLYIVWILQSLFERSCTSLLNQIASTIKQ